MLMNKPFHLQFRRSACLRRNFLWALAVLLAGPAPTASAKDIRTPKEDAAFLAGKKKLLTARWDQPFGAKETVSNHAPLGPYMGNGDVGVVSHTTAATQTLRISKVDFVTDGWADWAGTGAAALPVGGMTLRVESAEAAGFGYEMDLTANELRMTTGTASRVRMTSWIAAEENIVVTELASEARTPVTVTLETFADSTTAAYATTATVAGDIAQATRRTKATDSVKWISRAGLSSRIVGCPSETGATSSHKARTRFVLKPGRTVYAVLYVSGGGRTDDARLSEAANRLARLDKRAIASLKRAKDAWWDDMWKRSYVETGDSLLDRHYLSSIYLLASAYNRHSPVCGGMYGVWNMADNMMYHGDIHLNYNSQGGLYSVFSAGRPELALPYFGSMERLMPEGRRRAREDMGNVHPSLKGRSCRGILFPVSALGIGEFYCQYWQQTVNAPFNVPLFSWYYEYTGDIDFLRRHAYPYLRECGDFYEDYIRREELPDGGHRYCITTGAHEGSWDQNPSSDLAFVELTFRLLLRYSRILDTDADRRALWEDIVGHMPAYRTIMPTREPNEGLPVFAKNEAGWDLPNHAIQLHPVYPCELINLRSDKRLVETARNTLHYYEVSQRGFTHCMNELGLSAFVMGARLGYAPELLIENMKELIARARPNFLITDGHHCLEKTAVVETLNSMMLQSVDSVLYLFPDWIKKPASFRRLRAKGAFLVSADYDGKAVGSLLIHSEKGGPCLLRSPWPGRRPTVVQGSRRITATETESGVFRFETQPGKTYEICPEA